MKKIRLELSVLLTCMLLLVLSSNAQTDKKEVTLGRVSIGEVDYAGFKLSKETTIYVEGTGASVEKWGNDLLFYGWIIDSETRELVWSILDEYENEYFSGAGSFDFKSELTLKEGTYEIYYTGMFDRSYYNYEINDFADLVNEVVRAITDDDDDGSYYKHERYFMTVRGEDGFESNSGREYIDRMAEKSIVSLHRTRDHEMESKEFALTKETKIYIYCQGERDGHEFYDFAWINNLKTHEKVWPNNSTDYDWAGGGRKNFLAFQEITLPAGDYQVNYVTDGSHSYDRWNVMPPNDPQMWGVVVWCDREGKKNVSDKVGEYSPVVDLTRIRDNDFESQGFELTQNANIRVVCLGEIADYDPDDYGWIIDANTRETIWTFTRSKSKYAGGANKNRMVNEVIFLKKGKYIAYFASDGSHSYRDWNAAPPYSEDLWGLSLWIMNDTDKSKINLFDEDELKNENVIAEIIRVRDNERKYENFTLNKESKVRIYAIGEGDDGNMFDTGWIKNTDNGKIIWEMTYRTSEHAGGARKNRMFNDFIILSEGNYSLYFESDGSHSYMDWNAAPPRDQTNYGIQILKE